MASLFPGVVHVGVTFLWSQPWGGSHNDSHLTVHTHSGPHTQHNNTTRQKKTVKPCGQLLKTVFGFQMFASINASYIKTSHFSTNTKATPMTSTFFLAHPTPFKTKVPGGKHWCWHTLMQTHSISTFHSHSSDKVNVYLLLMLRNW